MKTLRFLLPVLLVMFVSGFAFALETKHDHKFISGTVEKIESGLVTIESEKGITRTFSLKSAKKEDIASLKKGDQLYLEIEEGNTIVDVHRLKADGTLEHPDKHQTVIGTLAKFDRAEKKLTLKLRNGNERIFTMKDAAATKMMGLAPGIAISVELDENNHLVNDFAIGG